MSPPPGTTPTSAHRGASNRAIRRVVADRAFALARRAGVVLTGRAVRDLADAFIAAQQLPEDEAELDQMILDRLMRQAPGGRRTKHQQWQIGEVGWRTSS